MEKEELTTCIAQALAGNNMALEALVTEIKDSIFNLSLRMLGSVPDAEDAAQDILIRVLIHLSSYQGKSAFTTWVYRIASNYLIDYKKTMFARHPLDFDFYAKDIQSGFRAYSEDLLEGVGKDELAEELKLSCTNVMLQCFDAQTRCIFILGTMFQADSKIAGEILELSPENYRQKLSRARKKMAGFLAQCCGLTGTGCCSCKKRLGHAIEQHRLHPQSLDFQNLKQLDQAVLFDCKNTMEKIDDLSLIFEEMPHYKAPVETKAFLKKLLQSESMKKIQNFGKDVHHD